MLRCHRWTSTYEVQQQRRKALLVVGMLLVTMGLTTADTPQQCRSNSPPVYYRASSNCSLSLGCARSLCSCSGLFFNSDTTSCVAAASSAAATCDLLKGCVTTAISCFQEVSRLTSGDYSCLDVSAPLHTQLLLAAMGSTATLTNDCVSMQCTIFNLTQKTLCTPSNTVDTCPLPRSYIAEVAIAGPSWSYVLQSSARVAAIQGSIAADVAALDSSYTVSSAVTLVNASTIAFNVTLPLGFDTASFSQQVSNLSAWSNTDNAYHSYGGLGSLAAFVSRVFNSNGSLVLTPSSPATTAPTNSPPPTPNPSPMIDATNTTLVNASNNACDTTCVIGLAIGVPIATLLMVGVVVCVANSIYNRPFTTHTATPSPPVGGAASRTRAVDVEMVPKPPSSHRKYRSNEVAV